MLHGFTTSFTLTGLKSSHILLQLAHRDHFANQQSTTTFGMKLNITN